MRCFYCAEDIKDEAVVCRFCKRDVMYLKQMVGRIALLEQSVDDLRSILVRAPELASVPSAALLRTETCPRLRMRELTPSILAMLFGAAATAHSLLTPPDVLWSMIAALLCPLPFGIWAGVAWKGRHPIAYALSGAAIGASVFFVAALPRHDWDISMLVVLTVIGCLLFLTGGLLGDWIERKRHPDSIKPGYAEILASKLSKPRPTEPGRERANLKQLADAVSGFAPVMTFIASILTAYLSYEAAILPHLQPDPKTSAPRSIATSQKSTTK